MSECSEHLYTDRYGNSCSNSIYMMDEDTVVFGGTPQLEYDIAPIRAQLKYAVSVFGVLYLCHYRVKDGELLIKSINYRGKPILKHQLPYAKPMLQGFRTNRFGRIKEALICYEFPGDGMRVDYTGKLLCGQEFIMRYYPLDDKYTPCPFEPSVYRRVYEICFEHGKEVSRKLVETHA